MDGNAERRKVIARLRNFPLPIPLTGETFCATLAAQRHRAILCWPMALTGGHTGLWLADDHADHILFECLTSWAHQQLAIYHEAAHILWGHRPRRILPGRLRPDLFPGLDLARMQTVMARHDYSDPEELVAELTARELLLRTGVANGPGIAPLAGATAPAVLRRLAADLEGDVDANIW